MEMNETQEYFIYLLSCFINKKEPKYNNHIILKELYDVSLSHNLSGAIYSQLKLLPDFNTLDSDIINLFNRDYRISIILATKQNEIIKEIDILLNKNNIYHIFLKGACIRQLYPIPEMRTMGDIDILIKENDLPKTNQCILSHGYINTHATDYGHWNYIKNNILLEIHNKSFYKEIKPNSNVLKHFNNIWTYTKENHEYNFLLNENENFIYLLMHLIKHLYHESCGVKMFMDIAVFYITYKNTLDWEYINKTLIEINLEDASNLIFYICNKWFDTDIKIRFEYKKETYEEFSNFVLIGGRFGYKQGTVYSKRYRQDISDNKNPIVSRIKYYQHFILPNKERLINDKYIYLKTYPYLLPIAQIHRLYKKLFCERTKTNRKIKAITNANREAQHSIELFKKLNL